jgi:L-idonate 5-dehydrogenase
MFFLGSAGRFPHVQGGFAQHLVLRADQIIPVPDHTDLLKLSVAEPLSVGLHAFRHLPLGAGRHSLGAGR